MIAYPNQQQKVNQKRPFMSLGKRNLMNRLNTFCHLHPETRVMSPKLAKMMNLIRNAMKKDRVTDVIAMTVTKKTPTLRQFTIHLSMTSGTEEKGVAVTGEDAEMITMTQIEMQMVESIEEMITKIIEGMDMSQEINVKRSTGVMVIMMIGIAGTETMIEMITMTGKGEVLIGVDIIEAGGMIDEAEVAEAEVVGHLVVTVVIDEKQ